MTHSQKVYHVDYAVIGSGVAGLRAAIELSDAGSVLVLAKSDLSDSATAYAQGGIAVALSDEDEIGLHEQDTIKAGDGLCRAEGGRPPRGRRAEVHYATDRMGRGIRSRRHQAGVYARSRAQPIAHSARAWRLHRSRDQPGTSYARASVPHLHLRAHAFTTSLIVEVRHRGWVRFIDEIDGSQHEVRAAAVLLATGGLGRIYRETTNPDVATGDGMAIAYDAGAVLSDMEFVQFHPTALWP